MIAIDGLSVAIFLCKGACSLKDSLPFDAEMRRRLLAFLLALALLLSFFLIYLFRMQIFGYEEAQKKVLRQVTVGAELGAPRGQILSSQGEVLAESRIENGIRQQRIVLWRRFSFSGDPAAQERFLRFLGVYSGTADFYGHKKDYRTACQRRRGTQRTGHNRTRERCLCQISSVHE